MEDIQAKVAALSVEVKYLKWLIPAACGLVAVLILVFWNIERGQIGARVKQALDQEGIKTAQNIEAKALEIETNLIALEQKALSTIQTIESQSTNSINVYQCPVGTDGWNPGSEAWAYYGCQGQITTNPQCENVEYPSIQKRDCTPIGELKLY